MDLCTSLYKIQPLGCRKEVGNGKGEGQPPLSRDINADAGPHPGVDFGTQTLTGLQGLLSPQRPLPARLQD